MRDRFTLRVRAALVAVGIAVSLLFGWLAVRNVHLGRAWHALEQSQPWWLVPALALLALTTIARTERWRALFTPDRRPPFPAALMSMLVGYLFNNILPLRAGEVARVADIAERSRTPRAEAVATIALERVFDVVSLLVLLFVLAPWYPHVGWFHSAVILAVVLTALVAVAVLALALLGERLLHLLLAPFRLLRFVPQIHVMHAAGNLTHGLAGLRRPRVAASAFVWTTVSWLLLALSSWCVLRSFHFELSPVAGILVVIAWNLALILPSSAAGLGVFEAAVVVALGAYHVSASAALAAALVLHAVNFVPYVVVGAVALWTPRRARLFPDSGL